MAQSSKQSLSEFVSKYVGESKKPKAKASDALKDFKKRKRA
jgi:hypothetical protein